jgi:hypothetical protein
MKKLLLLLIAATAIFVSCKKNDAKKSNQDLILGKWKGVSIVTVETEPGKTPVTTTDTDNETYEFKNDGKVYYYLPSQTTSYDNDAYSINGNTLTIAGILYQIKTLNNTAMVLFASDNTGGTLTEVTVTLSKL